MKEKIYSNYDSLMFNGKLFVLFPPVFAKILRGNLKVFVAISDVVLYRQWSICMRLICISEVIPLTGVIMSCVKGRDIYYM